MRQVEVTAHRPYDAPQQVPLVDEDQGLPEVVELRRLAVPVDGRRNVHVAIVQPLRVRDDEIRRGNRRVDQAASDSQRKPYAAPSFTGAMRTAPPLASAVAFASQ
jgi:hypothetical protein